jgi:hypothetical protein
MELEGKYYELFTTQAQRYIEHGGYSRREKRHSDA